MITAINLLSVIPMRKEPSHRSEMVSQLLFGEYAEIKKEDGDFVKVKCVYDDYEGWVQANQLMMTDGLSETGHYVGVWCDKVLVNGHYINIPFGSPVYDAAFGPVLPMGPEIKYRLGEGAVWNSSAAVMDAHSLEKIYSFFLNAPYLWGGKSVFGIDCSGFVQQVFKMFGIKLLRDAYLQAQQGEEVDSVENSKRGDLAFFQNDQGRVTHVGIVLRNKQIVHASGKVRIDFLHKEGIENRESGKRTHVLHSMRRFF